MKTAQRCKSRNPSKAVRSLLSIVLSFALNAFSQGDIPAQTDRVTLIYSSDLYWPPDDPDDYFDLATLFSFNEIDVRGIILDQQLYNKRPQSEGTGAVPLRQIFRIVGRTSAYEVGLRTPLRSINDQCLDQDPICQKGVEMLIEALDKSDSPGVLLTVGTLRDIAAAYNRSPKLFREKVSRVYVNAGIYGFPQGRFDVNLEKDRNAFVALMRSGLAIYWAPCFGEDNFETLWQLDQRSVLETASADLQNYFLYAFSKGAGKLDPLADQDIADPVEFLKRPLNPKEMEKVYAMTRSMWSTVTFLDAAGLRIFRDRQEGYTASRQPVGSFTHEIRPYSFRKMNISIDDQGRVPAGIRGDIEVHVLHQDDPDHYRKALKDILKRRFSGF